MTVTVGYWGDIDSEGLAILSDARSRLSSITPLMMDELTVKTFAERMVPEPDSVSKDPVALTETELALFKGLRAVSMLTRGSSKSVCRWSMSRITLTLG